MRPMIKRVIVIGAGHAGCEAALAAARLGCAVTVVSLKREHIGRLSCNPAVGGLAKGNLVREIDALGGAQGIKTPKTLVPCFLVPKTENRHERGLQGTDLRLDP